MPSGAVIPACRVAAQRIGGSALTSPAEVVGWLGAIQAQDYGAAKWAIGIRMAPASGGEALVERAVADGTVLRTHAFRGTWQFVTPADIRWMTRLATPRLLAGNAGRYQQLELTPALFRRSHAALSRALRGVQLTRQEIAGVLERARIELADQRLAYLLERAELEGLICSGARRGAHATYALLDERVPAVGPPFDRPQAIALLAERYFTSRGPATVHDFSWWSGLTVAEAREGLEAARHALVEDTIGGVRYWRNGRGGGGGAGGTSGGRGGEGWRMAHLLPAFDEYLVAYRDRDAVLDRRLAGRVNRGGGILNPVVIIGGRVVGRWRRTLGSGVVRVGVDWFARPAAGTRGLLKSAAQRYAAFLGREPILGSGAGQ
jgi:hypothetical protein